MPTKRKTKTKIEEPEQIIEEQEVKIEEQEEKIKEQKPKAKTTKKKTAKFPIGSIVFVAKEVEADLNGFCLFSQYKKDPYTVEAYEENTDIYTLRRQKLLIRLKESDIMAPDENAHDTLNKIQY